MFRFAIYALSVLRTEIQKLTDVGNRPRHIDLAARDQHAEKHEPCPPAERVVPAAQTMYVKNHFAFFLPPTS